MKKKYLHLIASVIFLLMVAGVIFMASYQPFGSSDANAKPSTVTIAIGISLFLVMAAGFTLISSWGTKEYHDAWEERLSQADNTKGGLSL
jgi:hypothetical protein